MSGSPTRGVITNQQRAGALRGMKDDVARIGANVATPDESARLDAKRGQLASLVSRTKDVTNNSYHFVQRMRDVGFTIQFVSPTTNLRALKIMDGMDEERLRVVHEKHSLQSHLQHHQQQQGESGSDHSSPSSPTELATHMTSSAREAHAKSVQQKKFSLKNQQMKLQIATEKLSELDTEYAELQKQLAVLNIEGDVGDKGEGQDAAAASLSNSVNVTNSITQQSLADAAQPPEVVRSPEEIFNEHLLDAASKFFIDSNAVPNKNSRLRVLQLVSELCQRPIGNGRPPVCKDLSVFEMIGNQFGDSLASLSTFVLRDTSLLKNISLGNTCMSDSGCAQLALALGSSVNAKRLRGLFIGGNEIHGAYAALLLQALRTNPHIAGTSSQGELPHELIVDLSANPLFRNESEVAVLMREVEALRLSKPSITVDLPPVPKSRNTGPL